MDWATGAHLVARPFCALRNNMCCGGRRVRALSECHLEEIDMIDPNNPVSVAQNMFALRGREAALERLARYISKDIRSETPVEFWKAVRDEVLKM